jgi:hypothetical protein
LGLHLTLGVVVHEPGVTGEVLRRGGDGNGNGVVCWSRHVEDWVFGTEKYGVWRLGVVVVEVVVSATTGLIELREERLLRCMCICVCCVDESKSLGVSF